MSRPLAITLLVITTLLWGFAFVAQKTAMDIMGPFTFSALRYGLAAIIMAPLAVWEYRRKRPRLTGADWLSVLGLSLAFLLGVSFQQVGLTMTTVTNGGFLTGLYVMLVPVIAFVALRHRPHPILYLCAPMALVGLYLLNGGGFDRLNAGDLLAIACAFCWAVQVLFLGIIANRTGLPIGISVACFFVTALVSSLGGLAFESFTPQMIADGWVEIVYTGVLSTAVAFTLQAIGQQYVPPSNAAIILSAESLFAALGGAVVLGERLPALGYLGAAVLFLAIVLVEAIPALTARPATG